MYGAQIGGICDIDTARGLAPAALYVSAFATSCNGTLGQGCYRIAKGGHGTIGHERSQANSAALDRRYDLGWVLGALPRLLPVHTADRIARGR